MLTKRADRVSDRVSLCKAITNANFVSEFETRKMDAVIGSPKERPISIYIEAIEAIFLFRI